MQFAPAVLRNLSTAPWPGNVRQLRNEVMRLAACAAGPVIQEEDLWQGLPAPRQEQPAAAAAVVGGSPKAARPQSLKGAIEQLEREMIAEALTATRNNQQQAARRLGLSRQGLINKLKRYDLG
jgi:DNA-binding NtrC family response regulator